MNTYRVSAMDGLRGFSLLGILLANMLIFQYGIFGKDEIHFFSLSPAELGAYKAVKVLVEGSFMPIFTFLFGYSMIKMKESLERKGAKVNRHFIRRFFFLLALGILHSTFLWEGDILVFYGMMGFFLLVLLNRQKKTLMIWGIILFLLTPFIGYGQLEETPKEKERMTNYLETTQSVYGSGDYMEIKDHRNNEDPLGYPDYMYLVLIIIAPIVHLPLFLFGMHAAKNNRFAEPLKERAIYIRSVFLFLPAGLALKIAAVAFPETDWAGVYEFMGAGLLSLGYIYAFACLYTKQTKGLFPSAFEYIGKLSLTNYLMQTVICTTIFYGYGLGMFGKLGVLAGIMLALVIYAAQVAVSYLYLKKYKRGPLEILLRMWTNFSWNGQIKEKKGHSSGKSASMKAM